MKGHTGPKVMRVNEVRAIRAARAEGVTLVRLGRAWGLHPKTVGLICTGRIHATAGGLITPKARRFTSVERRAAANMLAAGAKQATVAAVLDTSRAAINYHVKKIQGSSMAAFEGAVK